MEKNLFFWYNFSIKKGDFMVEILIETEFITLGQFLKYLSLVSSGGEVKFFLENNDVFVNEIMEKRRGKKLFSGDFVQINEKNFIIKRKNVD